MVSPVLCRGWRDDGNGDRTAVLSASEYPTPGFIDRLAHEYALKDELDSPWAARPLALAREHRRWQSNKPLMKLSRSDTSSFWRSYLGLGNEKQPRWHPSTERHLDSMAVTS